LALIIKEMARLIKRRKAASGTLSVPHFSNREANLADLHTNAKELTGFSQTNFSGGER
jgi:hypothetical protein